jgi:hypothetical protein
MRYLPNTNVNIFASSSLKNTIVMNPNITPSQLARIRHHAERTTPPRARNAAEVRENCQHWVIKAHERLQGEGIVTQSRINEAKRQRQLLPHERMQVQQRAVTHQQQDRQSGRQSGGQSSRPSGRQSGGRRRRNDDTKCCIVM